jgi:tetratricopeptide (TPR) repeat protein
MIYKIIFKILLIGIFSISLSYAEIGGDYFLAIKDQQNRGYLSTVEKNHITICPHNPNGIMGDISEGKFLYAFEDLRYVLDRFPNHPKALMLLGSVARLAKNISIPIFYYQKALRLYPQHAITHAQFGLYLVDIGRVESGIARLKQAIEIDPKLAVAHVWLAKAFAKNGKPGLARQAAERARALGYRGEQDGQSTHE